MVRAGVGLLGFGGPDSAEAVAPFMRNLTGREPSDELCARVWGNYQAIGGASPLLGIACRIAAGLEDALRRDEHEVPVEVGMAFWHPFVADAVANLAESGCDRVIAMSLSPFESSAVSGACRRALNAAAHDFGVAEVVEAPLVSKLAAFSAFFAEELCVALQAFDATDHPLVVFSAHSLPLADLTEQDPYVAGLRDVAQRVVGASGLAAVGNDGGIEALLPGLDAFGSATAGVPWLLAYQSKGQRPGEWLGPDLNAVLDAVAKSGRVDVVVVCPIGFLTDHMETLFDLDIVAKEQARSLGLRFLRVGVPNDDARVISAMAEEIEALLGKDA